MKNACLNLAKISENYVVNVCWHCQEMIYEYDGLKCVQKIKIDRLKNDEF